MMPQTLNDIFFAIVERGQDRMMLAREASGWTPISSRQLYQRVGGLARALDEWGVRCNLTFRGRRFDCAFPWPSVLAGILKAPERKRPGSASSRAGRRTTPSTGQTGRGRSRQSLPTPVVQLPWKFGPPRRRW